MRNALLALTLFACPALLAQLTVQPNATPLLRSTPSGAAQQQAQAARPAPSTQPSVKPNAPTVLWSADQLAAQSPHPRPNDVGTPEQLLAATYDVISGPAGPRDWDRFRSLFLPGAHLNAAYTSKKDGKSYIVVMSVEDYVTRDGPVFEKMPFFETPLVTRWEKYGRLAQAYSAYISRSEPGGPAIERGINSFQMLYDGHRWWVAAITWQGEERDTPLPADMDSK